jgi:mono/diheme cytochrome c family protein
MKGLRVWGFVYRRPAKIICAAILLLITGTVSLRLQARFPKDDAWIAPSSAKSLKNPVPVSAAGLSSAKAIYADKCVQCHGETGKGDGPESTSYSPLPASISDPQRMSAVTDGELFWKITEGRRPMPSFRKQLNDEQRWQLVNYIRSLAKPPSPANSTSSAAAPSGSPGAAKRTSRTPAPATAKPTKK